ncbi:MAG: hypothetical protein HC886_23735 [Leptolyngbyaceae cyanobacterium SM1_1_3]|nr:hypothetical protein [Leptolyngbyaceae cyanobacterium SM1_1_3]
MKTLFITVGTRQVGWRCRDDRVCCFGADGDRNEYPRHVDRLYQELGVERGREQGQRWGVQDLSDRYYQYCLAQDDFSPVELLLDHQVIEQQYAQGLEHVVLWGTNQPETTAWSYRNKDTHWLAYLMAGKIEQNWPELKVEIFAPVVDAGDNRAIRQMLEAFMVAHTQPFLGNDSEFSLLIQSKGAVPAIAQSLEICAAGLVRQFPVFSIFPAEPVPLFAEETQSANRSGQNEVISIGEYFWPIERLRIVSAWQRGDFQEAAIWLVAHQNRYRLLYRLAKGLTLATNWQLKTFFGHRQLGIAQWLASESLSKAVEVAQLETWRMTFEQIRGSRLAQTWEARFLVYLLLIQGSYTDAFMRFAQTLERLLYLQSETEGWFSQNELKGYHPGFKQLIDRWFERQQKSFNSPLYKQFDSIRNTRNQIVHGADSVSLQQIYAIWIRSHSTDNKSGELELNLVYDLMTQTLQKVCDRPLNVPENSFLESLYSWGLAQLL